MSYNNNAFFNAALCGFLQGALAGRNLTSATAGTYTNVIAAAVVFAAKVDTNIGADGTITSTSAIVAPTTATIQGQELSKCQLVHSISAGAMHGRYTEDATAADYATVAAAVGTVYTAAAASLVNP